nr:NBS-containing resistance-like protein [Tanacetum cinerariifolium]
MGYLPNITWEPFFTSSGKVFWQWELITGSGNALSILFPTTDRAGCPATRRPTFVYCVFLGDNLLTWSSKLQDTLSRSSAEAEYRGVANAVAETSWIRNLLRELHTLLFTATLVYCDNVSVVYMSANPLQHQRTKHIEIDIHFVRDKVAAGHVRVLHIPSKDNNVNEDFDSIEENHIGKDDQETKKNIKELVSDKESVKETHRNTNLFRDESLARTNSIVEGFPCLINSMMLLDWASYEVVFYAYGIKVHSPSTKKLLSPTLLQLKLLWDRLSSLVTSWNGETIIMGGFKEVRWEHERLFHSWFLEPDFVDVVENPWGNDGVLDTNDIVHLKNKLKALKNRLKVLSKTKRDERVQQKGKCTIKLEEIDKCFDQGHRAQSNMDKLIDAKLVNDFRPISLIGCFYKIIGKILAKRLSLVIDDLVSKEQLAFIKGCQILDGPFILNEMILWCKSHKRQTLMLKINFQKAYDSVRWDFLDDILSRFHFGKEPLSPIPSYSYNGEPSHLIYYNHGAWVVFSDLHSLMGVSVPFRDVETMATVVGCKASNLPVTYLGVKVGENMARSMDWSDVISKEFVRLSKWKVKTLSAEGRLTLLKSVLGSISTYYMSLYKAPQVVINSLVSLCNKFFIGADFDEKKLTWVAWKKVLSCKENVGLGVNSLLALNHALHFKWIWRFKNDPHAL